MNAGGNKGMSWIGGDDIVGDGKDCVTGVGVLLSCGPNSKRLGEGDAGRGIDRGDKGTRLGFTVSCTELARAIQGCRSFDKVEVKWALGESVMDASSWVAICVDSGFPKVLDWVCSDCSVDSSVVGCCCGWSATAKIFNYRPTR